MRMSCESKKQAKKLKNMFNAIQSNEAISTLKSKIYHKYKIIEPRELKCLSCNELNFLYYFLHLTVFCRRNFLPQSKYFSVYEEQKSCSQHLQITHSILLPFFAFLQIVVTGIKTYHLRISRFLFIMSTSFY